VAEEITLKQDVDRVLPDQQAKAAVPEESLLEREPFDDQRAFASIDPENPEATLEDQEAAPSVGDMDDAEDTRTTTNRAFPAPHRREGGPGRPLAPNQNTRTVVASVAVCRYFRSISAQLWLPTPTPPSAGSLCARGLGQAARLPGLRAKAPTVPRDRRPPG
jgi:hypothetical protein